MIDTPISQRRWNDARRKLHARMGLQSVFEVTSYLGLALALVVALSLVA